MTTWCGRLDVADLLGPPFTWEKFDAAAVTYRHAPLPNSNRQIDSLRALAVSQSGRLVANQPLEIWLSNHIEALILTKARQPKNQATPELSGLGWTGVESESLLEDLARDLAYERTNGGLRGGRTDPCRNTGSFPRGWDGARGGLRSTNRH